MPTTPKEACDHGLSASWGFTDIILVQFTPGGHFIFQFTAPLNIKVVIFKTYFFNTSRHNMCIYYALYCRRHKFYLLCPEQRLHSLSTIDHCTKTYATKGNLSKAPGEVPHISLSYLVHVNIVGLCIGHVPLFPVGATT